MKPRLETADHQPPAAERDPRWRQRAACTDHDPETWFPVVLESGISSHRNPAVREAVHICQSCPVAQECLQWADTNGIRHGIWGGRTPQERARPATTTTVRLGRCRTCRTMFDTNGGRRSYCSSECRPTGGRAWDAHDSAILAELAALGLSDLEIGKRLDRTRSSICTQRTKLGIPPGLSLTAKED